MSEPRKGPGGNPPPEADFGATTVSGIPADARTRGTERASGRPVGSGEPSQSSRTTPPGGGNQRGRGGRSGQPGGGQSSRGGQPTRSGQPSQRTPTGPPVAPPSTGMASNTRPPLVTGTAAGWSPPPQMPPGSSPPAGSTVPPPNQRPVAPPSEERGGIGARAARALRPPARGPRRAKLQLRHINPATVLRFSCVLAVALFFVWLIVVGVLYAILDASGVISKINDTVTTINGPGSKSPVTGGVVFGGAAIVGVINVVLFIALTTVGSLVYNLCADLVGGIELTLSER